jgi:hypothetical protein
MGRACSGRRGKAYGISVGKPEGTRQLGIYIRRLEDNIKMDVKRDRMRWCRSIWLRIETSGGLL